MKKSNDALLGYAFTRICAYLQTFKSKMQDSKDSRVECAGVDALKVRSRFSLEALFRESNIYQSRREDFKRAKLLG